MKIFSLIKASLAEEQGASLVETAVLLPMLLLLLLGAVDFGRAFYLAIEIAGAAQAGAAYGIQKPTDTAGMQAAAASDAPDVPNLTIANSEYGCECSDGTSYSASCSTTPTCSANMVYRVSVTVSSTYKPWFPWPGIPSSMQLKDSAALRTGGS
jgi:Flp pilus assembly protein TadG